MVLFGTVTISHGGLKVRQLCAPILRLYHICWMVRGHNGVIFPPWTGSVKGANILILFVAPLTSTPFFKLYFNILVSNVALMKWTTTAITHTTVENRFVYKMPVLMPGARLGKRIQCDERMKLWRRQTVMTDLSKCYFCWHVNEFLCSSLKGAWIHCHTHFTHFCSYL